MFEQLAEGLPRALEALRRSPEAQLAAIAAHDRRNARRHLTARAKLTERRIVTWANRLRVATRRGDEQGAELALRRLADLGAIGPAELEQLAEPPAAEPPAVEPSLEASLPPVASPGGEE